MVARPVPYKQITESLVYTSTHTTWLHMYVYTLNAHTHTYSHTHGSQTHTYSHAHLHTHIVLDGMLSCKSEYVGHKQESRQTSPRYI